MNLIKPCHGPITSLYDKARKHPITGNVQPHWGIDYGSADDNTIMAAATGVVRFIGRGHKTAGNYIVITHPNGWESAYLHLASISVSVGQSVVAGKAIGIKGMTGGSTGIHLHFELARGKWIGGSSLNVDPALYIDDPDVRLLQTKLNRLGHKLIVDGKYGDSTKEAVKDYQFKNGLAADGVAGRLTMAAIEKTVSELAKEDVTVASEKKVETLNLPQWQKEEMSEVYKLAREKDVFSSVEHEVNVLEGNMSIHQSIFLATLMAGAALNGGNRVK